MAFLWFGTEGGGIFRYDGYEARNYGSGPGRLSDPNIFRILEDPTNPDIFWIGTMGGLNCFDKATDTFRVYRHEPNDPNTLGSNGVNDIIADGTDPHILWIATLTNGLNRFDTRTEICTCYGYDPNNAQNLNVPEVWRIIGDRRDPGILWLSSVGGGLVKFEKETERFTHYTHDPDNPHGLHTEDQVIGALIQDRDNPDMLWLGTMQDGLVKFDTQTERFTHYRHDPANPESMTEGAVLLIYDNGRGKLWIGGLIDANGLTLFDKANETFRNYRHDSDDPQSLSSDLVINVYEDRTGIFWITTYAGTVDKIDPYNHNFTLYQHNSHRHDSLSNNTVTSIYEDRAGAIWLGTQGGLNKFHQATGDFTRYTHEPDTPDSLDSDYILGMYEDASGTFWVSQLMGPLITFDRETGTIQARYRTEAESFTKMTGDPDNPRHSLAWNPSYGIGEVGKKHRYFYFLHAGCRGASRQHQHRIRL